MSIILEKISLSYFRNHVSFMIQKPKALLFIIGQNATGKTNIIEAVQLLTMMESFRSPLWKNVVTFNQEESIIRGQFQQNGRILDVEMRITEGKRSYFLNNKKKKCNEIQGLLPAVIFVPDDLEIIKSSSEVRRKLIDEVGEQLSSTYRKIASDYQKTLLQRNRLLKDQRDYGYQSPILESWDENLITLGALLFSHRVRLYKKICFLAQEYYQEFSPSELLEIYYQPSFKTDDQQFSDSQLIELKKEEIEYFLRNKLNIVRAEERARAKSLVGPHRDEIKFLIDGKEARIYGSQGQQRSIILALKCAQIKIIKEISGNDPILLLDDVMSELDEKRRKSLISIISEDTPVIITATDLCGFDQDILNRAQIINLDMVESKAEK